MESLWGEDFDVSEKDTSKILKKIKNPKVVKEKKEVKTKKNISLDEKIKSIEEEVLRILGVYKDKTIVITNVIDLHNYISRAIENKVIAIDTETNNSLDPITCSLMGPCIYTPNMKNAYIPVNHTDFNNTRLENQVTEDQIREEFSRLSDTFTILHNGKFDYQVLKCTTGYECRIDWDTLVGAKLIDENERSYGLKQQYISKIDPTIEKYDIEHLFKDVKYQYVRPEIFALYAATDPYMTYRLYEYQMNILKSPDMKNLLSLANNIEMPLVKVLAEMELAGLEVDQEYSQRLSKKYHDRLDEIDKKISIEIEKIQPKIDAWKITEDATRRTKNKKGEYEGKSKSEQLSYPINLGSPTQLAILFYDILNIPTIDKKSPRGTGEDTLKVISEQYDLPICDYLLERRECTKLLSTYIDSIPELAKRWPDGRVRTHFNQYGAATGRLSSSDPLNMQNIPAHEKSIRMLFKARDGYRIIGADYSAQEPRLTAFYSQDENMIKAYKEGKDLYSVIASLSFNRSYEDCLEFYPEGTKIIIDGKETICGYKTHQNKEGKTYRSLAKSILLGVLYGRGAKSVGEQIGKSKEEAQEIIDKFFSAFPKVKKWIDKSMLDAHKLGYVEDIAGRRRRLPDILLDKYEVHDISSKTNYFNPILFSRNHIDEKRSALIEKYKKDLQKLKYSNEYDAIKGQALKDNIEIINNSGFIAQAERQAVNSRVQGGAATLTKNALLRIHNDTRMKDIGAYLINTVHDEILMEVPEQYSEQAETYLSEDMIESAKDYVTNVPMKCDTYNVRAWYHDEYCTLVEYEFKKMLDNCIEIPEAFEKECKTRCESTRESIYEIVKNYLGTYMPKL